MSRVLTGAAPIRRRPWPLLGLVFACLFAVFLVGCRSSLIPIEPPRAVDGVLDLRGWDFDADGPVPLTGQWQLAWGELLEPETAAAREAWTPYAVPGAWNDVEVDGAPVGEAGVATARLRVLLPPERGAMLLRTRGTSTAHRLWFNGREQPGAGTVSTDLEAIEPASPNALHAFPDADSVVIVVQIANRDHRQGGQRRDWLLGNYADVSRHHTGWVLYETLTMTTMFVVGCAFLLFYATRRRGVFRMYFGLFALACALRTSVAGDGMPLTVIWPGLPWATRISLEYATSWAAVGLGVLTVTRLYHQEDYPPLSYGILGLGGLAALTLGLGPARWSMVTVTAVQAFAAFAIVWVLIVVVRAVLARRSGSRGLLAAMLAFLLALVHDIARARGLLPTPFELTQPAFVGVVLIEAAQLARSFAQSYTVIEQLSKDLTVTNRDLEATNKAVERFVPYEFLHLLDRTSIRDVDRGDNAGQVMDVLFCDLRSFTTIIESLEPEQAFAFINDYLSYMEPQIRKHKGFVNSYLGDAYLALYYGGGDETLRSAIAMMRSLEQFNAEQGHVPNMEIRAGIGVHSGSLMLGTIGGLDRLDSGVIGDPVNTASRVEGMTKMYGTPLLISEATYRRIESLDEFRIRELDRVVAKGKTEAIRLYEVLDGLPEVQAERKWATREAFAAALALYREGRFEDALAAFRRHLGEVPEDAPARLYTERCQGHIDSPPVAWTGVTILTRK